MQKRLNLILPGNAGDNPALSTLIILTINDSIKKILHKIAIQIIGTRWQVGMGAMGLSRGQQFLIYVHPFLLRYLSILFLNIFIPLAFAQSVDNVFH